MTQDYIKSKKDLLISKGWEELLPQFDLNHFLELDLNDNLKHVGYYVSFVTKTLSNNIFNLFSEETHDAYIKLLKSVTPVINIPKAPVEIPCIHSTWPFNSSYWSNTESAFSELTYRVIIEIVKSLGKPKQIYQSVGFNAGDDELMFTLDPKLYNMQTITIAGKLILLWDDIFVSVQAKTAWTDNGAMPSFEWALYSNNIRNLTSSIIHQIGIELNPNTYQLGMIEPEFKLNSFPEYILDYTADLSNQMGFSNTVFPERFNIIIEGPPGYGKTRWTHSFTSEVLAPKGYLIMSIDYSTLQDIIIPEYIDKVCIIINDADTLALNRHESKQGNTEQVLAWLDGSRSSFIKPFYLEKCTSIITIMTANSTEKWDKAALRKGRVHAHYNFDQVKMCNYENNN